jgi:hypothetical protein
MANKLYPKSKKQFLQACIDLSAVNVRAVLVDTGAYTYNDAHDFLHDIPSGARITVSGNLTGKAFGDDGSFDSDDPTFTSVSGASIEAIVLYVHTGTDSTSRLIMYQDTSVTGLPLTPDGSDVQITVDAGGWFVL